MLLPTIVLGVLALLLVVFAFYKGEGQHVIGLKLASKMTIQILPMVIFALIVAGMVQVLIPQSMITKWIGSESGLRGIFIGTVAGGFAPGGPYVSLPIALAMLRAGAGVGTMVAFLTGWSLWAISRLPMEVGLMGWKFTLIRLACTFFFLPIAGLIAQLLFSQIKI